MNSTPEQDLKWPQITVRSEEFKNFIRLLKDLKNLPAMKALVPKICLKCWTIFGKGDASHHADHHVTGEFQNMEEASEHQFLDLSRCYQKVSSNGKNCIKMYVTKQIQNAYNKATSGDMGLGYNLPSAGLSFNQVGSKRSQPTPSQPEFQFPIPLNFQNFPAPGTNLPAVTQAPPASKKRTKKKGAKEQAAPAQTNQPFNMNFPPVPFQGMPGMSQVIPVIDQQGLQDLQNSLNEHFKKLNKKIDIISQDVRRLEARFVVEVEVKKLPLFRQLQAELEAGGQPAGNQAGGSPPRGGQAGVNQPLVLPSGVVLPGVGGNSAQEAANQALGGGEVPASEDPNDDEIAEVSRESVELEMAKDREERDKSKVAEENNPDSRPSQSDPDRAASGDSKPEEEGPAQETPGGDEKEALPVANSAQRNSENDCDNLQVDNSPELSSFGAPMSGPNVGQDASVDMDQVMKDATSASEAPKITETEGKQDFERMQPQASSATPLDEEAKIESADGPPGAGKKEVEPPLEKNPDLSQELQQQPSEQVSSDAEMVPADPSAPNTGFEDTSTDAANNLASSLDLPPILDFAEEDQQVQHPLSAGLEEMKDPEEANPSPMQRSVTEVEKQDGSSLLEPSSANTRKVSEALPDISSGLNPEQLASLQQAATNRREGEVTGGLEASMLPQRQACSIPSMLAECGSRPVSSSVQGQDHGLMQPPPTFVESSKIEPAGRVTGDSNRHSGEHSEDFMEGDPKEDYLSILEAACLEKKKKLI